MLYQIKHRYTGTVLFETEATSWKEAVLQALATDANLTDANLTDADLTGANLRGANLRYANLTDANLTDADLTRAYLRYANLRGANLTDANLRDIEADLRLVLNLSPNEVPGLLEKLKEGKVNGSVYEGECCCLVGTLANVRGVSYLSLPGLAPNGARPAERWFLAILEGHTPENSQIVKITCDWIEKWQAEQVGAQA